MTLLIKFRFRSVEWNDIRHDDVEAHLGREAASSTNVYLYMDIDAAKEYEKRLLSGNVKKKFTDQATSITLVFVKPTNITTLRFYSADEKQAFLDTFNKIPTSTAPGQGDGEFSSNVIPVHQPKTSTQSMFIKSGQEFQNKKKPDPEGVYMPVNKLNRVIDQMANKNGETSSELKKSRAEKLLSSSLPVPLIPRFIIPPAKKTETNRPIDIGRFSGKRIYDSSEFYSDWPRPFVKEEDTTKYQGFRNLGNTCYINAVLQALTNMAPFTTDLLNEDLLNSVPIDSIYRSLVSVLQKKSKQNVVNPRELKDAIAKAANKFADNQQEDAHEFLGECLDLIASEVKPYCDTSLGLTLKQMSSTLSSSPERSDIVIPCPVTTNFRCEVEHVIECKNCQSTTVHTEQYRDFSLDLPEHSNVPSDLPETLTRFFAPEEIQCTCEQCNHQEATVYHKIKQMPRVLVLHLKRFRYDFVSNKFLKRRDTINFAETLNISMFCSTETMAPTAWSPKSDSESNVQCTSPSDYKRTADQASLEFSTSAKRRLVYDEKPLKETPLTAEDEDKQLKWAMEESLKSTMTVEEQEEAELQLALKMSEELARAESTSHAQTDNNPDLDAYCRYNLRGVISHQGPAASNGHYVCDVWDSKAKTWRNYNDSVMTDVGSFKTLSEARQRSAYLFFYVYSC